MLGELLGWSCVVAGVARWSRRRSRPPSSPAAPTSRRSPSIPPGSTHQRASGRAAAGDPQVARTRPARASPDPTTAQQVTAARSPAERRSRTRRPDRGTWCAPRRRASSSLYRELGGRPAVGRAGARPALPRSLRAVVRANVAARREFRVDAPAAHPTPCRPGGSWSRRPPRTCCATTSAASAPTASAGSTSPPSTSSRPAWAGSAATSVAGAQGPMQFIRRPGRAGAAATSRTRPTRSWPPARYLAHDGAGPGPARPGAVPLQQRHPLRPRRHALARSWSAARARSTATTTGTSTT